MWRGRVPVGVLVVFALFLLIVAYLITASFVRRTLPTFAPSPMGARILEGDTARGDTVTIDARNPTVWRFFDFDRAAVQEPPDTTGWDLAFRRFHIMTSGRIAIAETVRFDALVHPPSGEYMENRVASDTTNPAVADWYDYNFLSHLLEPKARVYVVRTREGRFAKFEILSYYCPGLAAGCFTIRFGHPLPLASGG